jgi:hypothetical protein
MANNSTKTASIVVIGAGEDTAEIKELDLHPGVTVAETLASCDLGDYRLSRGKGSAFLAGDDDLYALVEKPGEKFYASTIADQGR